MKTLSLCIPTFNRSDFLSDLFESLTFNSSKDFELIIVDNCSTDNTFETVCNFKKKLNIQYFLNEKNMGVNYSVKKIIKNANGKYIWIIGDDEILYKNSIDFIIKMLGQELPDLVSLNFDYKKINSSYVNSEAEKINFDKTNFEDLTNKSYSPQNILNTFFSSLILSKKIINLIDFKKITDNVWQNEYSIFPISSQLPEINNKINFSCLYVENPLFLARLHKKNWSDKLHRIKTEILPNLLNIYSNSNSNTYEMIKIGLLKMSIKSIIKNPKNLKLNIKFFKNNIFNKYLYLSLVNIINEKITLYNRN
ncbi:glycosyltransferase family 2 protein [Flavobacteriaceae bacterium]|nr:glycosyltransferase family 2 protein [Flavobacteriaceae bacterium]